MAGSLRNDRRLNRYERGGLIIGANNTPPEKTLFFMQERGKQIIGRLFGRRKIKVSNSKKFDLRAYYNA